MFSLYPIYNSLLWIWSLPRPYPPFPPSGHGFFPSPFAALSYSFPFRIIPSCKAFPCGVLVLAEVTSMSWDFPRSYHVVDSHASCMETAGGGSLTTSTTTKPLCFVSVTTHPCVSTVRSCKTLIMSNMSSYSTSPGGSRRENPRPRVVDSRPVYDPSGSTSLGTQPFRSPTRYVRASGPVDAPTLVTFEDEWYARRTSSRPVSQDHSRRIQPLPVIPARSSYERQVADHQRPRLSPTELPPTPLSARSLWERQVAERPARRPFYDERRIDPLPVRSYYERQVTAGNDTDTSLIEPLAPTHTVRSIEERQVPVASLSILSHPTSSRHPLNNSLDREPRSMGTQSLTHEPNLGLPSITHTGNIQTRSREDLLALRTGRDGRISPHPRNRDGGERGQSG